ncbi:unnamed protein product [Phytophthora lilii]|uniref:Unnamed protein product n=1 Tax=Phytophthora lilii TaxID=2077276 RepID=A0A9W6YIK6_9STRA|nr:unnamed protein product [Phytophthora lilii]
MLLDHINQVQIDNLSNCRHEEEAAPWVVDIEPQVTSAAVSLGACVNPVARDSGFIQYADSSASSSGGMQSFTFSTSQKEATKVVEANTPVAPSIPAPPQSAPAPSLPVAPTSSAIPPPVAEAPSIAPPPAPVEAATTDKQATVTAPEHVTPPPTLPPVLPPVEGADLATKGVVVMARNRNAENPVRAAWQRKWYARAWWVGVHVYGYVVLGVKGALSPQALPTAQFVVYLVVAVATISCYLVLQMSSAGQLDRRPMLAPVQTSTPTGLDSPVQVPPEDGDDTELLVDGLESGHPKDSADLHFCNECHVFQPLRTKHW